MDSFKRVTLPVILNGDNYLLWARSAKNNLGSCGLWEHIEASKKKKKATTTEASSTTETSSTTEKAKDESKGGEYSDEDELTPEEKQWAQEDQVVLVALQNSLEASILEAYSYCEKAKELWDTLKNVYGDISNLTRVFEVKRAINNLKMEDMNFKKHFGKFRSLCAELEMLRPHTIDPKELIERREQDKVFQLLLSLNHPFNGLIKHILRKQKLPTLDGVCSQIQKEIGGLDLFNKEDLPTAHKSSLSIQDENPTANKGVYKPNEDKKNMVCEHCKKKGHSKEKCWILHPHLKPNKFKEPRANMVEGASSSQDGARSGANQELAMVPASSQGDIVMKKADLEALLQAMAAKLNLNNSGISLFSQISNDYYVIDSGASHHMVSNVNLLNDVKPTLGHVSIANGNREPIKGIGNLNLFEKESKAFYMPNFTSNLLSVKKATKDLNCYVIFGPNEVYFQDIKSGKLLGKGSTEDELYVLKAPTDSSSPSFSHSDFNNVALSSSTSLDSLWHARLGHPHGRALELILPDVVFDSSRCEACILGKHCKVVFPNSKTIYEKCFDLVHSDVWTAPCASRDQNKYFVTFIDEKSKYTWITLLPSKDRVLDAFQNFQNHITNQYNAKIKVFRSDNGGEYTSHAFKNHLARHGIIHQTSCPYTPQQNGVAERKNRHLMEVARSMMFHHNVPKRFWGDAVLASCYLINRIPTKVLKDLSPFEVINKSKPSIEHLRVFGCVCFVLVPGEQRNKLEPRSTKALFLGYSTTQKGYKCYDPITKRTLVSRDVKFFEEKSYYESKGWEEFKNLSDGPSDRASSLRFILEHLGNPVARNGSPSAPPTNGGSPETSPLPNEGDVEENARDNAEPEDSNDASRDGDGACTGDDQMFDNSREEEIESDTSRPREDEVDTSSQARGQPTEPLDPSTNPTQGLRRSTRVRSHPDTWKDKRVYYRANAVQHPIQGVCSIDHLPSHHKAFLSKIEANTIPGSYEEAKEYEVWVNAVDDEVGAMEKNHTWDIEDLPPGKRCVSSKWVFTIKYHSNGEIERYKARLVARGFTQTYGDDYTETFAPVAKQHTIKVVLSIATNLEWDLWQMDVKNAFLQGELEEEVYMTPPPGLQDSIPKGKVLRLRKAIYGLKQSPRAWYHKLSSTLKATGFKKSEADHTLFTRKSAQGIVVVLVYVDDIIISGDDKEGIAETKASLHSIFDIKDLGELKYFLGIEVCRSKEGLFLSQRKYTLDLLKLTGKLGCKPAKTPLEPGYKVNRPGEQNDKPFHDPGQYRRLVGKLIYLTYTRPDICFAVNQVSQHMKAPTVYHWGLVERILRYLKGSPGQGIWMEKNGSTEIVGYCDADWAGDRNDRKSTTGYCTFIGGNLATWKTKKQKVVSCSSAEAEYRAMRKLTEELTWLKALLGDLGIQQKEPIIMHCDNQAAIHIANNPVFHERTKHIELDCHKVREKIEDGTTVPCFTRSWEQLADIFTKAASPKVCNFIHNKLGLKDLTRP